MLQKILVVLGSLSMFGCAYATKAPLTGFVYSDLQAGMGVSSNQAGNRSGEACASSILGVVATGDASIETARRNGGITMITSVDERTTGILGVYATHCTVVRGR